MVFALAALMTSPAAVTIDETVYDGKPAYRVSNGSARLVVSPHLGRVVEYGLTDGPNVLWQSKAEVAAGGYRNVGGDKVWYAPQTIWNWPPDRSWDGTAMTAEKLPDGIRLTSERGKVLPLRLKREIRLDAYGPKVTFLNSLTNEGGEPVTVSLWQVTQVDRPTEIVLPRLGTAAQPRGYAMLQGKFNNKAARVEPSSVRIWLHADQAFKYGSKGGDGSLTATVGKFRFTTYSPILKRGKYADQDSAKQVYTAPAKTGYAELEHLAPLEMLDPRQIQQQTVTWTLAPLSN